MTQIIEIEGGLVRLISKSIDYQIPMADWIDKIEKRAPINTPVLPTGTRAMVWDPTDLNAQTLTVLIEREPHNMRMDYGRSVKTLSVPWTRFLFFCKTNDPSNHLAWVLTDYRVFWAKSRYADPAVSDMIPAMLPNVYGDGRICFGSTGANANQSLADRLDETVNGFFTSQFNDDLAIIRPNGARSWRQWERMTANNPTGWVEWDDWDPNVGRHQMYSLDVFQGNVNTTHRFSPMIAADPIPAIELGATFGRAYEWVERLDNNQRARLMEVMLGYRAIHSEAFEPDVEPEEDENA